MSTLFGKPKSSVVKHPGAFRRAAQKAGESTQSYAEKEKGASGTMGKRARLALTFAKMRGGK
jgi:hypothetical protein